MPASTQDTANLWTAQERERFERREVPPILPEEELDRALNTVAALIEALEATEHMVTMEWNDDWNTERPGWAKALVNARALLAALGGEK